MGRPRRFSEAAVLQSAAEAFARGGYEGTSIDDLVKALNLHRGSLYQAFGSKRGLFLAVLRHYVETHLAHVTQALLAEGPPTQVLEALVHSSDLDLLLIAALERGPRDAEVATLVRRALEVLEHVTRAAEPPPADGSTAAPAAAIGLLGARLYERLYDHGE